MLLTMYIDIVIPIDFFVFDKLTFIGFGICMILCARIQY